MHELDVRGAEARRPHAFFWISMPRAGSGATARTYQSRQYPVVIQHESTVPHACAAGFVSVLGCLSMVPGGRMNGVPDPIPRGRGHCDVSVAVAESSRG